VEIYTRRRGGTETCPACIRQRFGGLGPRVHTCLDHMTPGELAARERARRLAQLDRRSRRRDTQPPTMRTRSIGTTFEVW
jgi:hypothetical protein